MGVKGVALASTAAIGVFGAVVAQGTHGDLLHGLEHGYARYVGSASMWITTPGDDLATSPIDDAAATVSRVRGVRGVRPYYGGWLDVHDRRVWLVARKPGVPAGETVEGSSGALRPGSAAVSLELAHALHVHLGGRISVPTPNGGLWLRVAATTTNLGWSSGVLFIAPVDYTHHWGVEPTALEVDAAPRVSTAAVQRAAGGGLTVQTARERAATANALPRQGLERLSQVSWLLVVAAAVAIALAMGASIWDRRGELASLRLQSFKAGHVQRILAWEALLVIGSGSLLGAAAGSYGHAVADSYLRLATGYPVERSTAVPVLGGVVALVGAVALLVLAAPGFLAARAPLRMALDGR
jgi:putative ABC transport system permease protein